MKKINIILSCLMLAVSSWALAQATFKVGGYGRSILQTSMLGESDTANVDAESSSHALFDLGIDAQLNDRISANAIIRLYSDLNRFFDEDVTFTDIRQIQLKARLNEHLTMEIGDLNFKQTEFTLWNTEEEGNLGEAAFFSVFRDAARYENFNFGNDWRQQGTKAYGKVLLNSDSSTALNYESFLFRIRAANQEGAPDNFMFGQTLGLNVGSFFVNAYYNRLGLPGSTINSEVSWANDLVSSRAGFKSGSLELSLEGGYSQLANSGDTLNGVTRTGSFIDFQANYEVSEGVKVSGGFRSVSDDFTSPGAQTKRINFASAPAILPTVTNNGIDRAIGLADLYRDFGLYNPVISYTLMNYDLRFGNATPYGRATPNRQGVDVSLTYAPEDGAIQGVLEFEGLREVTGEGTDKLRNFIQAQASTKIDLQKLVDSEKLLILNLGGRFFQTNRNDADIPAADLSGIQLDAGVEVGLGESIDLLGGMKYLGASGLDYLAQRTEYNEILQYDQVELNATELLYGGGLRIRFNPTSSVLVHYQRSSVEDKLLDEGVYSIGNYGLIFNLNF